MILKKEAIFLIFLLLPFSLFSDNREGIRIWKILSSYIPQKGISPELQKMNRKVVRIPGFMVSLEMDGMDSREFLLVPSAGQCIHVPPPPPNQTIFVKMKDGTKAPFSWDPIWVTGYFEIRTSQNQYNTSFYHMLGEKTEDYSFD